MWLFAKKVWLFHLAFLGLLVGAKNTIAAAEHLTMRRPYVIMSQCVTHDIFSQEALGNISVSHVALVA